MRTPLLLLVLAASAFHRNGVVVTELGQAHKLLAPLLGTAVASTGSNAAQPSVPSEVAPQVSRSKSDAKLAMV